MKFKRCSIKLKENQVVSKCMNHIKKQQQEKLINHEQVNDTRGK